jgi:membrane fusion protein (multidrug efflux system)
MEIQFTVEGDTTTYTAQVHATEQSIETDTRSLKIRAHINNVGGRLLPGMFADVSVPLGKRTGGIMIPSQAIIPQARNKAVIVSRGGKAEFVPIQTGVRQASMVEVVKGLSPGDTIATTGIMFIRPGSTITFSETR